jgi:hypothetical protein
VKNPFSEHKAAEHEYLREYEADYGGITASSLAVSSKHFSLRSTFNNKSISPRSIDSIRRVVSFAIPHSRSFDKKKVPDSIDYFSNDNEEENFKSGSVSDFLTSPSTELGLKPLHGKSGNLHSSNNSDGTLNDVFK